ncbi:hypothetical protein FHG87_007183 [Trinorchestia longiramus]|nr:hypothetical protein FHG87_007183 [Trinorchestia longiramus]
MAKFTRNGSLARPRELCAEENGIPLIIKAEQVKTAATQLVKDEGQDVSFLFISEKIAWLPVRGCKEEKSLCHWPDGTRVTDGVFTDEEITEYSSSSKDAGVLTDNGLIKRCSEQEIRDIPILCSKKID